MRPTQLLTKKLTLSLNQHVFDGKRRSWSSVMKLNLERMFVPATQEGRTMHSTFVPSYSSTKLFGFCDFCALQCCCTLDLPSTTCPQESISIAMPTTLTPRTIVQQPKTLDRHTCRARIKHGNIGNQQQQVLRVRNHAMSIVQRDSAPNALLFQSSTIVMHTVMFSSTPSTACALTRTRSTDTERRERKLVCTWPQAKNNIHCFCGTTAVTVWSFRIFLNFKIPQFIWNWLWKVCCMSDASLFSIEDTLQSWANASALERVGMSHQISRTQTQYAALTIRCPPQVNKRRWTYEHTSCKSVLHPRHVRTVSSQKLCTFDRCTKPALPYQSLGPISLVLYLFYRCAVLNCRQRTHCQLARHCLQPILSPGDRTSALCNNKKIC